MPSVAVVAPFLNEQANIVKFLNEVNDVAKEKKDFDFTCLLIDDGSSDDWRAILSREDKNSLELSIVCISLSRNFGHQNALAAGFSAAENFDVVVTIDLDLQDPPFVILEMLSKWQEGFQVVLGQRATRKNEKVLKLFLANSFYRFFAKLTGFVLPKNVGDFRLVDKVVTREINNLKESNQFYRGLVPWLGFKTAIVTYHREARFQGKPKYNFLKSFTLGLNGILSFSIRPLILFSILGVLGLIFSLVFGLIQAINILILGKDTVPGWATLTSLLLISISIQFLTIGVLGLYIGRIYEEAKKRPRFLINEKWIAHDYHR